MKKIFILFLASFAGLITAQHITFVSEKTNRPLSKVSVFGKDGSILAYSDIDGKIDPSAITESQQKFRLVYENMVLAELSFAELNKEVVPLDERVQDIEPVIIKNNTPARYLLIKGNFNAYVTVNRMLNCYVDGIATYVFDNRNKKVKDIRIQQYRIFRLENASIRKEETGSWDYHMFLDLPALKYAGNLEKYNTGKIKVKELNTPAKDEIEISAEAFQEKELALFGYRIFDIRTTGLFSFEKGSKKLLRDFTEYNEIAYAKLKHKTEPSYNQVISYKNFYPTELEFSDNNNLPEVKYNRSESHYTSDYWEDRGFPNMQTVFSSFFRADLKEKQNKK